MKRAVFLLAAFLLATVLSGCRFVRIEEEERKPVSYTVVERQDIPTQLDEIMNEKKEKEFQLSYETGDALYLVEELGASSNGLFFVTRLIGPENLDEAGIPSYPCIVIKTEIQNKPVTFREGKKADHKAGKGE